MSIHEKLQLSLYFGSKALSQCCPDNDESQKTASNIHVARKELHEIIQKFADNFKDIGNKYSLELDPKPISVFRYPDPPS